MTPTTPLQVGRMLILGSVVEVSKTRKRPSLSDWCSGLILYGLVVLWSLAT